MMNMASVAVCPAQSVSVSEYLTFACFIKLATPSPSAPSFDCMSMLPVAVRPRVGQIVPSLAMSSTSRGAGTSKDGPPAKLVQTVLEATSCSEEEAKQMLLDCNNDCNEAVNRLLDGSAVDGIQLAGDGLAAAAEQAALQLLLEQLDKYGEVKSFVLGKDITEDSAIRAAMAAMAVGQLTLQRSPWSAACSQVRSMQSGMFNGAAADADALQLLGSSKGQRQGAVGAATLSTAGRLASLTGALMPAPAVSLQLPPLSILTWNLWYAVSALSAHRAERSP